MHLRSANVDLDGNIIVAGRIVYPADDDGLFPMAQSGQLRLSRWSDLRRIAQCRAERDPTSGFLQTEAHGSEVHVPHALALAIKRVLHYGSDEPIAIALQAQEGTLTSTTAIQGGNDQPLSDWRVAIQETAGTVHVQLSATLHATRLKQWMKRNYWSSQASEPARVHIEFAVDPATRIACFGSYIEGFPSEVQSENARPIRTSLASLDIEQAPVGPLVALAIDDRNRWVSIHEGADWPTISLQPQRSQQRAVTGFMNKMATDQWPGIMLYGINLAVIANAMSTGRLTLTLSNGIFGCLHQPLFYDLDPRPNQNITEAVLSFELRAEGLSFRHRCHVNDLNTSSRPYEAGGSKVI